ncbi:MAG: dihydrofolate reductase [Rhodothermales bacterium]
MAEPRNTRAGTGSEIVIIAAVAEENRVIGKGNDLPWHIPADLKRFKRLTQGYPMIMGRRTFESIVHQFGGPLPDRRLLVVTSKGEVAGYPEVEAFTDVEAAMHAAVGAERVFIGGGATIYEQFLDRADRLELTLVEGDYEGDTYFPEYEHLIGTRFKKAFEERHDGFRFVTYERI